MSASTWQRNAWRHFRCGFTYCHSCLLWILSKLRCWCQCLPCHDGDCLHLDWSWFSCAYLGCPRSFVLHALVILFYFSLSVATLARRLALTRLLLFECVMKDFVWLYDMAVRMLNSSIYSNLVSVFRLFITLSRLALLSVRELLTVGLRGTFHSVVIARHLMHPRAPPLCPSRWSWGCLIWSGAESWAIAATFLKHWCFSLPTLVIVILWGVTSTISYQCSIIGVNLLAFASSVALGNTLSSASPSVHPSFFLSATSSFVDILSVTVSIQPNAKMPYCFNLLILTIIRFKSKYWLATRRTILFGTRYCTW